MEAFVSRIISLSEISVAHDTRVGAKAANLGRLLAAGLPVPAGFVITDLTSTTTLSEQLQKEILQFWEKDNFVTAAVRSSGIGEDSKQASWAGQLETCLAVKKEEIVTAIAKCQQSLARANAQVYGQKLTRPPLQRLSVIVQKMIPSVLAGVLFTAQPVTGERDKRVVEAVLGLGELLVQGSVDVSHYQLHESGKLLSSDEPGQSDKLILDGSEIKTIALPSRPAAHLDTGQLSELVQLGEKIEKLLGGSQDIEWALSDGQFWILQARPITTV